MAKRPPPIEYFPARPRPDGRWQKRIRGRLYTWTGTREQALAEYRRVAKALYAGDAVTTVSAMTVHALANLYIAERHADAAAGHISQRHAADVEAACVAFARFVGPKLANDLGPEDFANWRRSGRFGHKTLPELAPATQNRLRAIILAMLRHAAAHEWIDRMPNVGTWKTVRTHQVALTLTPAHVAKLIRHAGGTIRIFVLLGINAGFGPTDCAGLAPEHIVGDCIIMARRKTGTARVCPLWPETAQALAQTRLPPRTRHGNPWTPASIGHEWRSLCRAAGVAAGGFYGLRHLFATLARDARDIDAYRRIMGRAMPGIDKAYIHDVPVERLRAVTDYVRARVLSKTGRPT
jgi:integrase